MLLKRKFSKVKTDEKCQEDQDLDKYEMLYGVRLLKNAKRLGIYKTYKEKIETIEEQYKNEQNKIMEDFFNNAK